MKMCGRIFLVGVMSFLTSAPLVAQVSHDGHWWFQLSNSQRETYLTAARDGMAAGFVIALPNGYGLQYAGDALTILDEKSLKQIAAAIDGFYADARNEKIGISLALGVAIKELGGTSRVDLDHMAEAFRTMTDHARELEAQHRKRPKDEVDRYMDEHMPKSGPLATGQK